ncbi:Rpn family recombination-promoting nuclease/putative transposase [Pseudothermotoga thermarum]|uniref:Transposase (putative) YhgA-like domain-containing protein n=1 Tax=Pseudothermotoga thermarum DSM 5069 TaxID=688269 RepID=F7YTW5_9THEM|nr:Rpn family recombination-promoting nuclease/putative transposase [Pseudothermotoga thermarum]AEH51414.1 hypothetical protein Theth_1351 [Pseudothermotoga thermarum DSM 5069]
MENNQNQPIQKPHFQHDKGYKFLLSNKETFLELLQSFIKEEWVKYIDEQDIVRIDKSFILQDFSNKEADLVYRVKLKGKQVIIYILLELQSSVDYAMPYRLLLYMVEIYRSILKDAAKKEMRKKDFSLPAIIPIVLYNGKRNWTAKVSYKEMLDSYELFGEHVLDFKYILIDVNRYGKEELISLRNLISGVFLLDQDVNFDELLSRLKEFAAALGGLEEKEFEALKVWVKRILLERFGDLG